MAAAEARAVWQRTANRCFVQEDAKRAPKLACCQSSSSTSKQGDSGSTGATDSQDHHAVGFIPLTRNSSYSNLPPDTRWWLQLQPGYVHQKGLTYEQLIALETEVEGLKIDMENSPSGINRNHSEELDAASIDRKRDSRYSLDVQYRVSSVQIDRDPKAGNDELNPFCDPTTVEFLESTETRKTYESFEKEPSECANFENHKNLHFDPETAWIGGGKSEPWWRTTDKSELASLVAQKSLDYIENCDLPPPQIMHVRRYSRGLSGCANCDKVLSSDRNTQISCTCSPSLNTLSSDSGWTSGKEMASVNVVTMQSNSDKSFSKTQEKEVESSEATEANPTKAELLEALRHSQTRAREAEKAAKQAYAEKEHIVKLFFKQASQLFAYKQWFQMLQLEALYYQIKNNEQPVSTFFPMALPWMPCKGRKLRKSWQKAATERRVKAGRHKPDVSKYAVAFAVGLSLVGAGLLLGWTVGWMLPF